MASTHKTLNLRLNNWLGSDKPKRDDFNADNEKLDEEIGALRTEINAARTAQTASESHQANLSVHVTAADKQKWNEGGGPVSGTYAGTGATSLTVNMGFKPKYGFLFGVGQGVADGNWSTGESSLYAGFFSQSGCSRGITVTSTGVTVTQNNTQPLNGCALKFNQSGVTYVYVAWRS